MQNTLTSLFYGSKPLVTLITAITNYEFSTGVGTKRRPKTQKRRPFQNHLEIAWKKIKHYSSLKQKRRTMIFAVFNEFRQGLRFVQNPTESTKQRPASKSPRNPSKAARTWFSTEAEAGNDNICGFQRIWPGSSFCAKLHQKNKTKTPSKSPWNSLKTAQILLSTSSSKVTGSAGHSSFL